MILELLACLLDHGLYRVFCHLLVDLGGCLLWNWQISRSETAMGGDEPAMISPNGLVPNFSQPKDKLKTVLLVTQCLCIPICSLVFALRVFFRFRFRHQLGLDECEEYLSYD